MTLDTAKAVGTLRSLTTKFDNAVQSAQPFYPELCYIAPSNGLDEEYGFLGNMPAVREWVGDRVFNELRGARFTITNKHWEDSLAIKKTDIRDDRLGLYSLPMEQMGVEAALHPDELFLTTLLAGASTACFDGQYFFDTDHSWGDSGTQSNDLTYNATDHTAVTAAEFRAAYHAARKAMMQFKNDRGKFFTRPISKGMSNLLLLVPPELELAAKEAITAIILGNNSNVVLDAPRIVVTPQLTTATDFYLFDLGMPLKPFVFQAREPLSRQMKGMDDSEFKEVKFMTEARYNVGYLAWWTGVLTVFN